MSEEHHSVGFSGHDVCDVYLSDDFVVTSGVNSGDGVASARDSSVGDVYRFSPGAEARDLLVPEENHADNSSDDIPDSPAGHTGDAGSEIGVLGDGLELDSRLTFMGSDGSNVQVLIIDNTEIDHGDDGPGDFFLPLTPLKPGIDYTLIETDDDPGSFSYADYTCVCFSRGTLIRLASGREIPIEEIEIGDAVLTRDNGAQQVRWIGSRTVPAFGHLAPVVITKDALGNDADLIVSPQHRMLLADWRAEVMLGSREVLVKARDLINGDTIYRRQGGVVEYFHILFDTHEIVYAEGIPSESLHINETTLDSLAEESRAEIVELFPHIEHEHQISAVASRMSLRSYEASALLKQVGFR